MKYGTIIFCSMRAGFTLSDPPNEGCRPNAIALAFSGNNKKFVPKENEKE